MGRVLGGVGLNQTLFFFIHPLYHGAFIEKVSGIVDTISELSGHVRKVMPKTTHSNETKKSR